MPTRVFRVIESAFTLGRALRSEKFGLLQRRWLLTLLVALLVSSVTPVAAEAPPANLQFMRLISEQGLSVGSVEVIYQDHLGYMWFGGTDGLVQYDGYNFTVYRNKPNDSASLSSNIIWDIHEDKSGQLWIATDIGINLFNRSLGNFTYFLHDKDKPNSLVGNSTRSIAEDAAGNLWIATIEGLSKLNKARTLFTNFRYSASDPTSVSSNEIRKLVMDHDGTTLWIGHYSQGLNRLDTLTNTFTRYKSGVTDGSGLSYGNLVSIFQDRDGFLWFGTDGGGLNRFNPAKNAFIYFAAAPKNPQALSHAAVAAITDDEQGNLWIATEGGLNYLDRQTLKFNRYLNNPTQKNSLASSNVHSVFVDSNHDLWVGNFPTGVNFLDTANMAFRTYRNDPNNSNSLSNSSILAIDEFPAGTFWLGTDGGGLNRFDLATDTFFHYEQDPKNPESMKNQAILSVQHQADGSLWMGAWHGGLNHFNPKTGEAKQYNFSTTPGSLSNDNVWALCDDSQKLWIGSIGGGVDTYSYNTHQFSNYHTQYHTNTNFFVTWKIYKDHQGQMWIGTNDGLGRYLPAEDKFKFYRHDPNDPSSISFDAVLDITEDTKQQLWIATRGGGLNLFDNATETFKHFRETDGLPDDVIRSVKADNLGNLWLGSAKGLTQFNPVTKKIVTYTENNGLQGNMFNFSSALKTSSGEMIFGGTGGFTIFDPAKLKANDFVPPVAIVDFQIFNKPVVVGAPDSPLTKLISETSEITLSYQQTVFSFSFSALSYRSSEKNKFAYMMEGFEKDWNYVGTDRRVATYTNLNPGTYNFHVKAANNEGVWNETGRSIKIHILPPPWKTWWAYIIYCLMFAGALYSFANSQRKKVLSEQKINKRLEKKVDERTQELQQKHKLLEEAYLQLEKISLSDPLTGLSNRRYLQKLIPMDVAKVQREYDDKISRRVPRRNSLDLAFFLLDVDYFKSVNDMHGHTAGDQLLIQLSGLLTRVCRETDCLVRWGGEEFLIVSRFSDHHEAPLMAERIREAVAQHEFTLSEGLVLRKTCSIGFASYPFILDNPGVLSWEQVIDTADHALYAAKRSGRNRSVGLVANSNTPQHDLYQKISDDLSGMIERDELTVVAADASVLVWKQNS